MSSLISKWGIAVNLIEYFIEVAIEASPIIDDSFDIWMAKLGEDMKNILHFVDEVVQAMKNQCDKDYKKKDLSDQKTNLFHFHGSKYLSKGFMQPQFGTIHHLVIAGLEVRVKFSKLIACVIDWQFA